MDSIGTMKLFVRNFLQPYFCLLGGCTILKKHKNATQTHRKKKKYYEQLYVNKWDNLEKNGQISRYIQTDKTETGMYKQSQ